MTMVIMHSNNAVILDRERHNITMHLLIIKAAMATIMDIDSHEDHHNVDIIMDIIKDADIINADTDNNNNDKDVKILIKVAMAMFKRALVHIWIMRGYVAMKLTLKTNKILILVQQKMNLIWTMRIRMQ